MGAKLLSATFASHSAHLSGEPARNVVLPEGHDAAAGTIELVHADTATHKGDMFTKDMPPKAFREKLALLRVSERARHAGA